VSYGVAHNLDENVVQSEGRNQCNIYNFMHDGISNFIGIWAESQNKNQLALTILCVRTLYNLTNDILDFFPYKHLCLIYHGIVINAKFCFLCLIDFVCFRHKKNLKKCINAQSIFKHSSINRRSNVGSQKYVFHIYINKDNAQIVLNFKGNEKMYVPG
jgi:hypothetical protein